MTNTVIRSKKASPKDPQIFKYADFWGCLFARVYGSNYYFESNC